MTWHTALLLSPLHPMDPVLFMLMHRVFWPAKLNLWPGKPAYLDCSASRLLLWHAFELLTVSPVTSALAALHSCRQLWPCFTSAHHPIPSRVSVIGWCFAAVSSVWWLCCSMAATAPARICREGQHMKERAVGPFSAVYALASSLQLISTVQLFGLCEACLVNSIVACCTSRAWLHCLGFPNLLQSSPIVFNHV